MAGGEGFVAQGRATQRPGSADQLEGLTGSATAGKRLLVRLRHSSDVKVASGGDTPLYSWIE